MTRIAKGRRSWDENGIDQMERRGEEKDARHKRGKTGDEQRRKGRRQSIVVRFPDPIFQE